MVRRLLVISDIHSNIEALEAVLSDARDFGYFDVKLCAGDIVGYGPNPNEVVERIAEEEFLCVEGNHDRAVTKGDMGGFNPQAAIAADHNQKVLSPQNRGFLLALSNEPLRDPQGVFALVHGSLNGMSKPGQIIGRYEDVYFLGPQDFPLRGLRRFGVPLGIVGHTHYPTLGVLYENYEGDPEAAMEFSRPVKAERYEPSSKGDTIKLLQHTEGLRAVVNFGSVGQPRDDDPRAAYGIVTIDEKQISLHYRRVPYDLATTQKKIREQGLPESLATRLVRGR